MFLETSSMGNNLRNAVYNVKRALGEPVTIRFPTAAPSYDPMTGTVERSESEYDVHRCVVMDELAYRKFSYDLAYIAAAKEFSHGAFYNQSFRAFLFDDLDLQAPLEVGWTVTTNTQEYVIDKVRAKFEGYTLVSGTYADASRKAGVPS